MEIASKDIDGTRGTCFPELTARFGIVCTCPSMKNESMGLTGVELLHQEWQRLVEERENVLRDVHAQKITFVEWNKLERMYASRVHEALTRLKHAQTRVFCREMVGHCKN